MSGHGLVGHLRKATVGPLASYCVPRVLKPTPVIHARNAQRGGDFGGELREPRGTKLRSSGSDRGVTPS